MGSSSWSTTGILILATLAAVVSDSFAAEFAGGPIVDVHDILPEYGLPKGLLPGNVKSYSLADDGSFTVILRSECYARFGDHKVYYGTHIEGKLGQGKVSDAAGIQAKKLFAWLPITGIVAHEKDQTVEFKVGFLSETLPIALFDEIPDCKSKLTQSI